jgi:RNA polymerase sigma-70 factor (ECF subfamily)
MTIVQWPRLSMEEAPAQQAGGHAQRTSSLERVRSWQRPGGGDEGGAVDQNDRQPDELERGLRQRADRLMERYADGDDAAFSELYDVLEPRLLRFALRYTGSSADSEDALQQTMLQIVRNRDRFVRGAPVLPWAYAIAQNLLRDQRPAKSRRAFEERAAQEEEAVAGPLQDVAYELKVREQWLAVELRRLPEKLRDAFLLVNVEQMPVAEAAAVLGISTTNTKQRAFRAREALVAALEHRER